VREARLRFEAVKGDPAKGNPAPVTLEDGERVLSAEHDGSGYWYIVILREPLA
jgi:hypothetical protein